MYYGETHLSRHHGDARKPSRGHCCGAALPLLWCWCLLYPGEARKEKVGNGVSDGNNGNIKQKINGIPVCSVPWRRGKRKVIVAMTELTVIVNFSIVLSARRRGKEVQ